MEVRSEAEADEAIEAGADIVMLDNMEGGLISTSRDVRPSENQSTGDELYSVARSLRSRWSAKRRFLIETSGGITLTNLKERAVNGTHHFPMSATSPIWSFRYRHP